MIQAEDFASTLGLTLLSPSSVEAWDIHSADFNRPGMQFCGFYEYFAYERPQVIGKVEMSYLYSMDPQQRVAMYSQYFSYKMPCVICCRGMEPPKDFLDAAREHDIAVYLTQEITTKFSFDCVQYLTHALAPRVTRHAVLVDVYGVGVFLSGKSGVGKSEAALELIKRGHSLVADDIVDICRISEDRLIGTCPEKVRHFMEIRGIGIIDIKAMYGISAVSVSKTIDVLIELETWDENKSYDRIGLEDTTIDIMGVPVPYLVIPVRPGRNLAIIVEVVSRNLSLKRMGYNAARELASLMYE